MSTIRVRLFKWRRHFLVGLVICSLVGIPTLSGGRAGAQGAATPTAMAPPATGQVVVLEPELDPPYSGDTFPEGWLRITEKSAYTIYMALGPSAADAGDGEMSGSWRPALDEPGTYRVEAYAGAGEIREYRELFPAAFPADLQSTESARYQVHHADGVTSVRRSQNVRDSDWIDLGIYPFEAGTNGTVELSNLSDEPTASIVAFSAVRFTPAEAPSTPPPTPALTATPTPTNTATPTPIVPIATPTAAPPPTVTPATTVGELPALDFGELIVTESADRVEVEAQFSINDTPVGVMDISYPKQVSAAQAENIRVDIVVTGEFTSTLTLAVRDLTQEEELGPLVASSQFFLTLDAQALEYGDETQRITVQTRREAGAAWNITPREGAVGEQPFNVKVVLNIMDGIPELSGPPLSFSIDVLGAAPPVSTTPVSAGDEDTGALSTIWFFLLILLLILVVLYILWRRRAIPVALGDRLNWTALRRGILTILESQFSQSEFETLCFNLGVEFEDLRGDQRAAKMQALVTKLERHNRIPQLMAALTEVEQGRIIDWRPIQEDLLRILADRTGDESFRTQLAALATEFSNENFRTEVLALLERLGDDAARRRFKALVEGEEGEEAGEEGLLLGRLRQHLDDNVNIPELVMAMDQADKETEMA